MRFTKVMLLAATVAMVSGCATRSYVDDSVARLEARVINQEDRIGELSVTSREALQRASDAGVLAEGKFLYSVVLTDDSVTFDSNAAAVSADGQNKLTELADQLKADNQNVFLEIQGHTDATGSEDYNNQLGLERAEAVRRYLHAQGVALDRMATISYGESEPSAPNSTAEGRATNRRVVIVVLD